jgi:DNA-binding NtrC family response regulator
MMKEILVVDDDENLRLVLQETLVSCGYTVDTAEKGSSALEKIKQRPYDLVITDLMMPGIKGIELISQGRKIRPNQGFLVISAYGTIETAVEAMQKGAFDFITKPFSISHIESRVQRFFEYESLREENTSLKKQLKAIKTTSRMVGESSLMRKLHQNIQIVAGSDAPVFIKGESGTGKELVGEDIHKNSSRSQKPFLKINCAAVPETLFESTLFGHEKGAFSGAYKTKKGLFEESSGGTLLLDEISEIPYSLQAKLLRVLQEMKIRKVGGSEEIDVDVRIIATTNRDIPQLIRDGKFREDLFFRLNVFPIETPALAHRADDIPKLIHYFVEKYSQKYKIKQKAFSKSAYEKLITYRWPGNVRQLEHCVERAVLYSARDEEILEEHLIFEAASQTTDGRENMPVSTLAEMEKNLILKTLQQTNNHKTQAAEQLGITVRTLRNKLNQFKEEDTEDMPDRM